MGREANVSVLLVGPSLSGNPAGYGGGKGGVSSAMTLLRDGFVDSDIRITYVPYGIRSLDRLWWAHLPLRFASDIGRLVRNLNNGTVVHIASLAGPALIRTLAAAVLSRLFKKSVLVDVRGNGLDAFAEGRCGFMARHCWRLILACSHRVFVQREKTAQTLSSDYAGKVRHQPNMISDSDIPRLTREKLRAPAIRGLFVGYCYRDKGVFDIVEGCLLACKRGLEIELTFVGQEHMEFSEYLESLSPSERLSIRRLGKQDRPGVLASMSQSDVFLFPTYHKDEGHPNVINEAMASQLTMIVTAWGSIGEVLDDETAYFVGPRSPAEIADALHRVDSNRDEARRKAHRAKQRLISRYSASRVLNRLRETYIELAQV